MAAGRLYAIPGERAVYVPVSPGWDTGRRAAAGQAREGLPGSASDTGTVHR